MLQKAEMVMRKKLESLYKAQATVTQRVSEKDPISKVTKTVDKTIYEDIACRLSFSNVSISDEDMVKSSEIFAVLFVGPEIYIPTGSLIRVKQNDVSYTFESRRVKVYKTHNEYIVKELERWL